jgi:protein-tyrosine kinase
MERIRQAVEQAKQERQKLGAGQERQKLGAARSPRDFPAGFDPGHAVLEVPSEEIQYAETRTVKISDEVRNRNRLVAAIENHPLRDLYKMLRTKVLQEMRANNWNTLVVTSPASGAGKTHTAINLAIAIAGDLSHTALLIDGDLRHPAAHQYFGFEPEFGLNDYLFNDIPLNKVLFHPDMGRLTVLPGKEVINESAEMLASPKIVSMLSEIRSRYTDRIIVLDVAPVLSVDDALALAPNVDCVLMVAEAGATSRDDLAEALEMLDGLPIIGTVLNKVNKKVTSSY